MSTLNSTSAGTESSRRDVPLRVLKLGGSLLAFDGLVPAFRDWHAQQTPATNVLLVGGGTLVDVVRHWDQRFMLDATEAHWLCVRLMDVTARVVSLLLAQSQFCDRFEQLQTLIAADRETLIVFSAEEFLQHHESQAQGARLPCHWSVTSDSIAARLASVLGAGELVLLKSADPPSSRMADAVSAGYVDAHFPQALDAAIACRCVNLLAATTTLLSK